MQPKPDQPTHAALGSLRASTALQSRLEKYRAELQATLRSASLDDEAVHRCRVLIKKLRAWIRLARAIPSMPHSTPADRQLRTLARALGESRDHRVLQQTIEQLCAAAADAQTKKNCTALRRRLKTTEPALSLASSMVDGLAQLRLPDATKLDSAAFVAGLRANYAKARKLGRIALADTAHPEQLHRFRRWVKYLHYQLSLLYPHKNAAIHLPAMLKELGSTLGQIHDLHELIKAMQGDKTILSPGRELKIDARQIVLLAEQQLGQLLPVFQANSRLLFAARPKEFIKLLAMD